MKNRIVKQLLGISVATVLFAQMPMLSFAGQYDIGNGDITITATADDVHTVEYTDISGQPQTATGDIDPVIFGEYAGLGFGSVKLQSMQTVVMHM